MNKHYLSLLLAASAGLASILTPNPARAAATIYVSNAGNNTIEQFTEAGVGSVFASTGLSNPQGLAFDSAGNLYVANAGNNTIVKFTPGGVGSVFASTSPNGPYSLAFDGAGNLYAVIPGSAPHTGTIEKFTPGGISSVFASGLFISNAFPSGGLAFDSAGRLYVATGGAFTDQLILRFTPAGVSSVFAVPLFGASFLPGGMAFDSTGNLYAAMISFPPPTEARIAKYTPGGVFTGFSYSSLYRPVPPDFDTMSFLGGLAFDSAGHLYAANPANNAIEKVTPGGVGSVFADAADVLSRPSFVAIRNDNVPEPSALVLLGLGLPALLCTMRLRRREA